MADARVHFSINKGCDVCSRIDRTHCAIFGHLTDGHVKAQRIELARRIAEQAQAIADGSVTVPQYDAVRILKGNADLLVTLTADDRPDR